MRTEYAFSVETGELAYSRQVHGNYVYTMNYLVATDARHLCSVLVSEGIDAEREFFNHFGDDSSWPPGWWARLMEGKFTRKSWARENYAHPPQSWEEYYEVSRPTDRWLKGVNL